jgi:hypothetical protein
LIDFICFLLTLTKKRTDNVTEAQTNTLRIVSIHY